MAHVGIIGARKYEHRQSVIDLVRSLPANTVVVTSQCRGVCTWAGTEARNRGLEVLIFTPDLNGIQSHGEMVERYYRRNRQLIAACEVVHAFISREGGFSGGTKYEVQYAKRLGKDVILHWEDTGVQRMERQAMLFGYDDREVCRGWKKVFAEALG
jgi:hypothetical protein